MGCEASYNDFSIFLPFITLLYCVIHLFIHSLRILTPGP